MGRDFTSWIIVSLWLSNIGIICKATDVECTPTKSDGHFSSHKADGIIYGISENNKLSEKDAAIYCSIKGKNDYVKFETIIYGEPPKFLVLESENDIFSRLNYSTISCSVSDVIDLNRVTREEEEKFFIGSLGNVEYTCGRTLEMKIVLQGLQTLSRDLSHLVQSSGKMDSIECEGDMDRHEKTNAKLGKLCGESNRYMYNESGNFVCSQCCTDHYWSRSDKQCKKCGQCSTRKKPNVWMDCTPTACKISTTSTMSSTTLATSKTTTFTTKTESRASATEPYTPVFRSTSTITPSTTLATSKTTFTNHRSTASATEPITACSHSDLVTFKVLFGISFSLLVIGLLVAVGIYKCKQKKTLDPVQKHGEPLL